MHINVTVLNARRDTVIAYTQSNKPMNSDGVEMQFNFLLLELRDCCNPLLEAQVNRINR
jgi:hypothetical protein